MPNYPAVFRAHQNRYIELPPERLPPNATFDETGFYQRSGLARFFEDFCRYDALYVTRDTSETQRQSQAIIRKAKRITETFRAARGNDVRADTPTQLGVEVTVACKSGEPLAAIPSDAQVKGTYQSFGLFGLLPPMQGEQLPSTGWGEVKSACRSPYSAHIPWVERLERDMLNAANGRALGEPEATFLSKNKTYRAILFRHIVHWDGTHRFGIVFVETLPRQFLGDQNTSLILAGLVVASRFRFSYLEEPDRTAAQFDDKVIDSEFEGNYRQFLYDLERMKQEFDGTRLARPHGFHQFIRTKSPRYRRSFSRSVEGSRAGSGSGLAAPDHRYQCCEPHEYQGIDHAIPEKDGDRKRPFFESRLGRLSR